MPVKCDVCGREFPKQQSLAAHKRGGHDKPWMDETKLTEGYVENGRTSYDLADEWGCDPKTVRNWLDRFDIQRRQTGDWQDQGYASYFCEEDGYMRWMDYSSPSRGDSFPVHRLLAIAEYGIEAVKGMHIHHENGVKWDNRTENLQIVGPAEHARRHYEAGDLKLEPGGIGTAVEELRNEVEQ